MILQFLALIMLGQLALFAVIQAIVVGIYARYMRPESTTESLPSTDTCAVLMSLRGADANLRQTLLAHLQQRDITYHLHWIVDSEHDPAVEIIRQLPLEFIDRWTLHVLELNSDRCSLKCLGLSQVARKLLMKTSPPQYFAFADGDGLVSFDWLRRLLNPMLKQRDSETASIGATTGHRWYTCFPRIVSLETASDSANKPKNNQPVSTGAVVRYFWNLGSLPQMHLFRVVWGGSWAIRSDVLRKSGLLESWEQSMFEDTQVRRLVETMGHRVVTAPGVLVQSHEPMSLSAATQWISRQLLDMRLYHSSFRLTLMHAAFLALLQGFLVLIAAFAVVINDGWTLWTSVCSLLAYQLFNVGMWWQLHKTAQNCLSNLDFANAPRGNRPTGNPKWIPWAAFGLILTQVVYPLAAIRAMFTRSVTWRGIDYRITAPTQIRRLNYNIYRTDIDLDTGSESV